VKPVIGKKYKLHIKESEFQYEYKGSGKCYGYEGFGLYLFNKLTPFNGRKFDTGNFLAREIVKEIK
jgi:hypothetical protein